MGKQRDKAATFGRHVTRATHSQQIKKLFASLSGLLKEEEIPGKCLQVVETMQRSGAPHPPEDDFIRCMLGTVNDCRYVVAEAACEKGSSECASSPLLFCSTSHSWV